MMATTAQIVVLVLGVVVIVASAWGFVGPANLMKMVTSVMNQAWGIFFAVIVRLVLGAALIIAAPNSSFPTVFEVLGWIAILAALVLAIAGRKFVQKLIDWSMQLPIPVLRLWLLLGMAFGGFLIYGVL